MKTDAENDTKSKRALKTERNIKQQISLQARFNSTKLTLFTVEFRR